jgi:hypothetical protein
MTEVKDKLVPLNIFCSHKKGVQKQTLHVRNYLKESKLNTSQAEE